MLRRSIIMMVLVLGLVALAAVAWASAAGPDWHPESGSMMGSDEPGPGARDEGDWADMAQWMQQMHRTSPGAEGEGDWADMAQWMQQMYGSGPGLCPHWGYASPGADDTPAG